MNKTVVFGNSALSFDAQLQDNEEIGIDSLFKAVQWAKGGNNSRMVRVRDGQVFCWQG